MLTPVVQRWRDRRGTYRPNGEPIDTSHYEVAAIGEDRVAKAFVARHHYIGTVGAMRFRFGLYRGSELAGVAAFTHPCSDAVLASLPGKGLERTELGRLVLLDDVPANGESWFVARCFELLAAAGIVGVCAFSDDMPRTDAAGRRTFRGHVGTVYQATNAVYVGRARGGLLRLLADGSVLHGRALAKLRGRTKGWRYVADRLEGAGAAPLADGEDARAWADRWVAALTRPVRHPGNHKYLFGLGRSARRALPAGLPYPKMDELAAAA